MMTISFANTAFLLFTKHLTYIIFIGIPYRISNHDFLGCLIIAKAPLSREITIRSFILGKKEQSFFFFFRGGGDSSIPGTYSDAQARRR